MIPESLSPLANHLWQSTLFAGAAGLLTLALRRNSARIRYRLWMTASIKFLIPLSLFVAAGSHIGVQPTPARMQPAMKVAMEEISQTFTPIAVSAPSQVSLAPVPSRVAAILLGVWAIGFFAVGASWWLRWRQVRAAVRAGTPIQLAAAVPVISSPALLEPAAFGIFRPVLLLPQGITERLTPDQLEAILAHEFCHVRRRDNLAAAVHMLVEAIFWFHPLVWWIRTRLTEERERACDEEVLRMGSEPRVYARSILRVCEFYLESPQCVSGVSGANLKRRIEAILENRTACRLSLARKLLLCAASIALMVPLLAWIVNAQPLKSFEVASVRLAENGPRLKGGGGLPTRLIGGRLDYTATVHSLIIRAFSLRGCLSDCDFVMGGPSWIKNDLYRIEAKLPDGAPPYNSTDFEAGDADGVYQMLQSLLADRFGLKMHREAKEVPVYALTLGPGGHKLTPTAGKMMQYSDGTTRLDRRSGIMPIPGAGPDGIQRLRMSVTNFTMQEFADSLSISFDRPVLDRTGVNGRFDFSMEFDADPPDPGRLMPKIGGPGLIASLREQLGLRLQATKAQVDVLAIDSIQRPSDN